MVWKYPCRSHGLDDAANAAWRAEQLGERLKTPGTGERDAYATKHLGKRSPEINVADDRPLLAPKVRAAATYVGSRLMTARWANR